MNDTLIFKKKKVGFENDPKAIRTVMKFHVIERNFFTMTMDDSFDDEEGHRWRTMTGNAFNDHYSSLKRILFHDMEHSNRNWRQRNRIFVKELSRSLNGLQRCIIQIHEIPP